VGFFVFVRAHAKVLGSFPGGPPSSEKDGIATGGGSQSQLVQSNGFATSGDDPFLGTPGESQSSDCHLGDRGETNIVGDGANLNDNFTLKIGVGGGFLGDAREGKRWAVSLGEEKATEDGLVERRISSPSQEPIELHQEKQVGVFALRGGSLALLDVMLLDVNTLNISV